MKVINPANEEVIAELKEDSRDSCAQKYSLLQKAQPLWHKKSLKDRINIIAKFSEFSSRPRRGSGLAKSMARPARP